MSNITNTQRIKVPVAIEFSIFSIIDKPERMSIESSYDKEGTFSKLQYGDKVWCYYPDTINAQNRIQKQSARSPKNSYKKNKSKYYLKKVEIVSIGKDTVIVAYQHHKRIMTNLHIFNNYIEAVYYINDFIQGKIGKLYL